MITFRRLVVIILGFALGTGISASYFLNHLNVVKEKAQIAINSQYIIAEIADDPREREKGLSNRPRIGINEGMLFIFGGASRHGFWMKNMRFPIDLVWIKESRVIGVEENVPIIVPGGASDPPLIKTYLPPEPVDTVLELVAGRARLMRVARGDEVRIQKFVNSDF